jgi:site-specific recombinase XerD
LANQTVSLEQVLAILSQARAHRFRDWLMFTLAFNHGLRVSEVVNLKAHNIRDGFLTVQRLKGSLKTSHPLFEHENPLLNERQAVLRLARNQSLNQKLFPIGRQHFWRLFRKYAELAGIPAHLRHPHILKHAICQQLIHSAGIENTRQFVGHKSMASTGSYLRVSDAQASEAARRSLGAV